MLYYSGVGLVGKGTGPCCENEEPPLAALLSELSFGLYPPITSLTYRTRTHILVVPRLKTTR